MNLDAYGRSQAATITRNYVESHIAGRPLAKGLLLIGKPGVGKTTLVRACAETYGAQLVETNASLNHDKRSFGRLLNAAMTKGDGLRILFFDEADNLTAGQQKQLLKVLQYAKCPVVIAGNADLEREVQTACLSVAVQPVRGIKSMRWAAHQQAGGEELEHEDDFNARIWAALRSAPGQGEDVPPGDWWAVNLAILDNTRGAEPLAWDLWNSRYRKAGADMAKYAQRALRLGLKDVRKPWSIAVRAQARGPPAKATKAPPGPRTKAPEPLPKPAPPPVPSVAPASQFF